MLLLFTLSAITQCTITAEWNDIKQRGSTLWSHLLLLLLPIFSRPRTVSSSLHPFLYFLNEVTEDVFCLPRLPPVRALARCSAAWQFNVVPDRGRIRRLEPKAVPGKAAPAFFFHSSHVHYPMFRRPLFSVGPASLWPALADALQKSKES
jgi:hypothetical protein